MWYYYKMIAKLYSIKKALYKIFIYMLVLFRNKIQECKNLRKLQACTAWKEMTCSLHPATLPCPAAMDLGVLLTNSIRKHLFSINFQLG